MSVATLPVGTEGAGELEGATAEMPPPSASFEGRSDPSVQVCAGNNRRLLLQPEDQDALSELSCLVRSHVEAFVATAEDVRNRYVRGGKNVLIDVGSVGIRCAHCFSQQDGTKRREATAAERKSSRRGAVSYPQSVRLVYQAVRNLQRYHLLICPSIPEEVKSRYLELKSGRLQGKRGVIRAEYWEQCCRRMGMIDTGEGIRLRNGRFADESDVAGNYERVGAVSDAISCSGFEKNVNETSHGNAHEIVNNIKPPMPSTITEAHSEAIANRLECHDPEKSQEHDGSPVLIESQHPLHLIPDLQQRPAQMSEVSCDRLKSPIESGSTSNELEEGENVPIIGASRGAIIPDEPGCLAEYAQTLDNGNGCFSPAPSDSSLSLGQDFGNAGIGYARPFTLSSVDTQPRALVLKRVKLAHSIVQATREIRHVRAGSDNFGKKSCISQIGHDRNTDELRLFGVELYELFSELEWGLGSSRSTDLSSLSSREDNGDAWNTSTKVHQRKKREKRLEGDSNMNFIPLSELGFPTSLCDLVSALLDEENSTYSSVVEVEEDLLLMARFPERYLFNSNKEGVKLTQINVSPDTLYGREEHTSALLRAFERMFGCAGPTTSMRKNEVVLLTGYSGTGKSSIVRSVQGRVVKNGASFVSGKFDAMQQMQPFSAIANALNEYCDFLAQDTSRMEYVREAVSTAVGTNIGVLLDLIPNLRKIIQCSAYQDPPSPCAFARDGHRRLAFLVRALFRVTCSKANPVVLFLDDLQWADEASMELVHALVTDKQLNALMFVGCYRDNEVGAEHPLVKNLNKMRNSETINFTSIFVDNLGKKNVKALVSDALHMLPRQTQSLAEVVQEKTGGNALFVVQFLSSLYDGGDLRFSLATSRWEWDLESIRARNIADNVVEFMKSKLLCLAPEVAQALKIAAAFGTECSEDMICIIERDPGCIQGVAASLDIAVSEGLMAKIGGSSYRFSHDQIQDAAYQLIGKNERKELHLQIGRCLRQHSSPEESKRYLFVIVDQLNRGSDFITNHNEKVELARLSLLAGQNSATMSAFLPAMAFLKVGVTVLSDNDWESDRKLCFDLYNLTAEMKFILGDFEGLKDIIPHVLGRARSLNEKLSAVFILVESLGAQLLIDEAIDTANNVLTQLGEPLPSVFSEAIVKEEVMKTQASLAGHLNETVLKLDEMQDCNKRQAMKFLNLLACYTYLGRKDLFTWVVCRMVQLSLSDGVCKESAYGFAIYGVILCGFLGDYSTANRLGRLAISLLNRFNAREFHARVYCAAYGFVFNWIEPLQASIPPLKESIDVGLSSGDTEFAMVCAQNYHMLSLGSGKELGSLSDEMAMYSKMMVEMNQNFINTMNMPLRQATSNLLGRSVDPTKLVGEEMNEIILLQNAEGSGRGTLLSLIYFYRMWLEYLFGEYERAAETSKRNEDVAKHNVSRFVIVCNHMFYSGLTALALARKEGHEKWENMIDKAMSQLEVWCSYSEWNCQHKLALLRAEKFYLTGDLDRAAKAYDLAVDLATKHRFVHEKALALERAGIFYLEKGDQGMATHFLTRACDCYDQWGACSKASHIRQLVPN